MNRLTLAIAFLMSAGSALAAGPLDIFLAGFDNACAVNEDFKKLSRSLSAKYNEGGNPSAEIVAPKSIGALLGPATRVKKDDFISMDLPLPGVYRDLKVKGLSFAFGIENGIYAYAIVFDEPVGQVHKTFDRAVAIGNRKLKNPEAADASTGVDDRDGKVTLYCDWSN
jgi:hypothetical protein